MAAEPRRSAYSVAEYLALEETETQRKFEYVDGQIVLLAGGTPTHAAISARLGMLLGNRLQRGSGCLVYSSDARVQLSSARFVYPDLTVSCDHNDLNNAVAVRSPRVVVEVLSPSTERQDRTIKAKLYLACPTIEEYLLVDSQRQWIDLLQRQGKRWIWGTIAPEGTITLASLSVEFGFDAVYADLGVSSADWENMDSPTP